jgi:hypothetical protein
MPDSYDVFLSHCTADKDAVEAVAIRLRDQEHIQPFLDKWHLVPGEQWPLALARAMESSRTVAVFVGRHGINAWHEEETLLALVQNVQARNKRIIPVLLSGTQKGAALSGQPHLPRFRSLDPPQPRLGTG